MIIHTNVLTAADLYAAVRHPRVSGEGTTAEVDWTRGSKIATRSIKVHLEGDGTHSKRRRNAGTSRNVDRFNMPYAATWDQWGWWLANLFVKDPEAVCGTYVGVEDFNAKTENAYRATEGAQ